MDRVQILLREPVTLLPMVWICLPVLQKLEVATVIMLISIAHASSHIYTILKEMVLDGGNRTRMYHTLYRASQCSCIVYWWSELHHSLTPYIHHKLLPPIQPFLMLGISHIGFKSIPIHRSIYLLVPRFVS